MGKISRAAGASLHLVGENSPEDVTVTVDAVDELAATDTMGTADVSVEVDGVDVSGSTVTVVDGEVADSSTEPAVSPAEDVPAEDTSPAPKKAAKKAAAPAATDGDTAA